MAGPIQPVELVRFLEHYSQHFNITRAASEIGRSKSAIFHLLETDPAFKKAVDAVRGTMGDLALEEAFRRAVHGWEEPLAHQGVLTGSTVTKFSDSLLSIILKATRPEFRDRQQLDITNTDGSLAGASDAKIAARLASILAIAQARRDRGEIIDAEIVVPALPAPDNSDLL